MRPDETLPQHALDRLRDVGAPLAEETDVLPESPVPEKYRLVSVLGRGGMGVVCEAEDLSLGRRVAIKLLRERFGDSGEATSRLRREAMVVARLSHPNIAAVFEATDRYIAMELVDGGTLAEQPDVEPRRVALWIRDAARAVHCAHEAGIIHRDIKPQNILVDRGGHRVFVTDFGLAKEIAVDSSLSASGRVIGTPAFMAPEQARGKTSGVGVSTDVYALGATLYAILSGDPPFGEDDIYTVLKAIVETQPAPLDAERIAPDLRTITMKCLEKSPSKRYASAAELADDLDRWLDGRPIVARPPTRLERFRSAVKRRRGLMIGLLVGLVLIGIASAVLVPMFLSQKESLGDARRELEQERQDKASVRRELNLWTRLSQTLTDAQLAGRVGEVEREQRLLDEGIELCLADLAQGPSAKTHFLHGKLLRARGRISEARAALDQSIELDPALSEAHFERGTLLVDRLTELYFEHRELYSIGPESPQPTVREFSSFERMFPQVRFLRQLAAADLSVDLGQSPFYRAVDEQFGQAKLARLIGETERAKELFLGVLNEEPLYVEASLSLARLALEEGDWTEAVRRATEAIERHRGATRAYTLRSRANLAGALENPSGGQYRNKVQASLSDADRVIELSQDDAQAYFERGLCHLALRDWEAAIEDLDVAIARDEDLVRAWSERARARLEQAKEIRSDEALAMLREAEADVRKAFELRPGIPRFEVLSGRLFFERALAEARLGQASSESWLAAREAFSEALRFWPQTVSALCGRARCNSALTRVEGSEGAGPVEMLTLLARADAKKAVELAPTSPLAWRATAEVAARAGATDEAIQAAQTALRFLGPGDSEKAELESWLTELEAR
ncbi:MAG: protein kinase [Planctomycetota bacterium]